MAIAKRVAEALEPPRWAAPEAFEEELRAARRVAANARDAAQEAVVAAAVTIKEHPLRAIAGAPLLGTVTGVLMGFAAARFARPER